MANTKLTHAGCVVFRPEKKRDRYLVISSKKRNHWVFPKGHIEPQKDANPQSAALRELREETGLLGEIVKPLARQTFMKKNERVVIQYFLVRLSGAAKPMENRILKWMSAKRVLATLSFDDSKQAFTEALETIRSAA
ncbi:MAG: NUDIX domain-containing protein [Anaerolineales bacterium]|nr:NUDIX domain-containing protein [Anaerolineales bacterium]